VFRTYVHSLEGKTTTRRMLFATPSLPNTEATTTALVSRFNSDQFVCWAPLLTILPTCPRRRFALPLIN
jgi:hypothetical protein